MREVYLSMPNENFKTTEDRCANVQSLKGETTVSFYEKFEKLIRWNELEKENQSFSIWIRFF